MTYPYCVSFILILLISDNGSTARIGLLETEVILPVAPAADTRLSHST